MTKGTIDITIRRVARENFDKWAELHALLHACFAYMGRASLRPPRLTA